MQTTYEYIRLIHNGNKNFKPIPLTEEWLLKFGFEKSGDFGEFYFIFNNGLILNIEDVETEFIVWATVGEIDEKIDEIGKPLSYINYVHQLQNLFYCLTNEELSL